MAPSTTSVDALWDRVRDELRRRVPAASFDTWFAHARALAFDGARLELGVPSRFIKNALVSQGGVDLLAGLVADVVGGPRPDVLLTVDGALHRQMRAAAAAVLADVPADMSGLGAGTAAVGPAGAVVPVDAAAVAAIVPPPATHPAYRFDAFVAGASGRLALAAARLAVERPGEYPVLILCGGTGSGKTHLLHAVAHAAHAREPSRRVALTDARRFVAEYTAAYLNKDLDAFRRRYAQIDLLVFDDFHALAEGNKAATAAEFTALLDRLAMSGGGGRQVVIATATPPDRLTGLPEGLRNRLAAGLAVRLDYPDPAGAAELVRAKASTRGIVVPPAAARALAEAVPANARALEGAAGRLCALVHMSEAGEATVALARRAARECLGGAEASADDRALTPADVARAVAEATGVDLAHLRGRGRTKTVRAARMLAAVLARRLTGASWAELGRYLDGRTHATVLSMARGLGGGWWRDEGLGKAARRSLSALGRTESLEWLFPEQGALFAETDELKS